MRITRLLPLSLLLAACARDADDAARPPAGEPSAPAAADAPAVPPQGADSAQAGLAVVLLRRGERAYLLYGRTEAPALQLSVEDGHNVLYGPVELEVAGGAFQTELALEPTGRETVFAYVTEPGGERQWVVPIPLASSRVAWGAGAAGLPEPAGAP